MKFDWFYTFCTFWERTKHSSTQRGSVNSARFCETVVPWFKPSPSDSLQCSNGSLREEVAEPGLLLGVQKQSEKLRNYFLCIRSCFSHSSRVLISKLNFSSQWVLCTELWVQVVCYGHWVMALLTAELHCSTLPWFQRNGRVKANPEQNRALPVGFSPLLLAPSV